MLVGRPSRSTLWRVCTDTDGDIVDAVIAEWTTAQRPGNHAKAPTSTGTPKRIRLDGKTVCGAVDSEQLHPAVRLDRLTRTGPGHRHHRPGTDRRRQDPRTRNRPRPAGICATPPSPPTRRRPSKPPPNSSTGKAATSCCPSKNRPALYHPSTLCPGPPPHWAIETLHFMRDTCYREDDSRVRTRSGPRVLASLRNLAIDALRLAGRTDITDANTSMRIGGGRVAERRRLPGATRGRLSKGWLNLALRGGKISPERKV